MATPVATPAGSTQPVCVILMSAVTKPLLPNTLGLEAVPTCPSGGGGGGGQQSTTGVA